MAMGGAAVVFGDTVVLPPVGGGLLVTPVLAAVCGVVSVAVVTVVLPGSVGVGFVVFAELVVAPEVVAEGLGLLVCPVGFTVLLPGEVVVEAVVVVVLAVVVVFADEDSVVTLLVAVGVRTVGGVGELAVATEGDGFGLLEDIDVTELVVVVLFGFVTCGVSDVLPEVELVLLVGLGLAVLAVKVVKPVTTEAVEPLLGRLVEEVGVLLPGLVLWLVNMVELTVG